MTAIPATERVQASTSHPRSLAATEYIASVFDEHEARIHGIALGATRDPELAADVTQDAFVRLLDEVRAGRYPDNPGAWLYRTAMNLVISRARRAAVARRFAPRLIRRDDPPSPEGMAVERERSRDMQEVLASLPTIERTVLLMAAQGLGGEEIAGHLGKSHGAVRTLLFRARTRLRRRMSEREAGR